MSLTVRNSRAPTRFGSLLSLLMLLSVALALLFAVSVRADESAADEFDSAEHESDGDNSGELDTDATTVEFDVLPAAAAAAAADEDDEDFNNYRRTHSKNYRDDNEQTYRRNIYRQNKNRVAQLNARDANAEFTVRNSPFSDYSPEEFKERFLMHNADIDDAPAEPLDARRHARAQTVRNAGPIPASFDWRSRAAVTPVKNQGRCGSCWAYSVADQVESQWFLAGNPLLRLSAQQFVDCDRSNYGCAGGWPGNTYNYLINAGGEALESAYPYSSGNSAVAGACKYRSSMGKARISSWVFSSKAGAVNETRMMEELYRYGPLSVCLAAADWQFYRGGVFTSQCRTVLDHCVQLIGYGVTNTGVKYWTIKNQWGTGWGEGGYMRLQRGTNKCAIGAYATRAIV